MDIPLSKSSRYPGYILRIDPEKEELSIFNPAGEFAKSIRLDEMIGMLLESKQGTKRKHLRTTMAVKVKYQSVPGRWKESITGTLGTGGLFIETPAPCDKGSEIEIEILLPDSPPRTIKAKGKVVWTRNQFEKVLHFPGMGVEFSGLSDKERESIERLIKTINRSRGIE